MKKLIFGLLALTFILVSCNSHSVPTAEQLRAVGITPVDTELEVPDISFTDQQGATLSLKDFSGSVVFLNFWATWCPPCRAEMPSMSILYRELGKSNFEMLALNVGEDTEMVNTFIKEFDIDFPVYFDPEMKTAQDFGISAFPTTILIDRDGTVRGAVVGALEWDNPEVIELFRNWSN